VLTRYGRVPAFTIRDMPGSRPLRVLRVKGTVLQTPVLLYRHPGTGREAALIGMSHAGEARYFRELIETAVRLEAGGTVVLCEMITDAPDAEWAAATDTERAARDAFSSQLHKFTPQLMKYLGWTWQLDVVEYGPQWVHADMTDLELIRSAGAEAVLEVSSGDDHVQQLLIDELGDRGPAVFAAVVSVLFRAAGHSTWVAARMGSGFTGPGGRESEVYAALVGARNERALEVITRQDSDVVLLWGADHLSGMAAGLVRAGFERAGVRWVDVGTVLPLWRAAPELARLMAALVRLARSGAVSPPTSREGAPAASASDALNLP
jgi:hypothetical protein